MSSSPCCVRYARAVRFVACAHWARLEIYFLFSQTFSHSLFFPDMDLINIQKTWGLFLFVKQKIFFFYTKSKFMLQHVINFLSTLNLKSIFFCCFIVRLLLPLLLLCLFLSSSKYCLLKNSSCSFLIYMTLKRKHKHKSVLKARS